MVNFRALDKRCPSVQSKGKTWDLTAGKRLQTARWLCLSPAAHQKVSITGLENPNSSFFPFTRERFMICCCFIPCTVQKEHSWREFHRWDIPRNHFLPQPGGMFGLTRYSDASMQLNSNRAPTLPHRSHGTGPHVHHCMLQLQAPASSACP